MEVMGRRLGQSERVLRILALLALLAPASCGSRVSVIPTPNAPHLPPTVVVHLIRGPASDGARELARIEINGSPDGGTLREQAAACMDEMLREARRLGADLVRVVEEGRHYRHPSVAYCRGLAYAAP